MRRMVCHLLQSSGLDEENLLVQKHAPNKIWHGVWQCARIFSVLQRTPFCCIFLLCLVVYTAVELCHCVM